MLNVIKLRRGLDIKLVGAAEKKVSILSSLPKYAVCPHDFYGVVPKLLVREGDSVKAGTPLFFDKAHPAVQFVSPVSGRVAEIIRGEKRRIERILIDPDGGNDAEDFGVTDMKSLDRGGLKELLLNSGLWPAMIQRPYGIVADHDIVPRSIFVSGFDSAPLAPDMDFALKDEKDNLQAGFDALSLLTDGQVRLGLHAEQKGVLTEISGVEKHYFEGPHPAGNVGVQINHVEPIRKGDIVWTVNIWNVAVIGRLLRTGIVDMRRLIAVTGAAVGNPRYEEVVTGAVLSGVIGQNGLKAEYGGNVRVISGNVLTGTRKSLDGFLGFYDSQITVIPEGNHYELFGWILPRTKKFSVSRAYFSWLAPKRRYNLDTNINGGPRALVATDIYDRYLPMDIYAVYLIKACLAGDIDKMENLGIYEVLPEDFAVCEFVDPSKTNIQSIIQQGIDLMIKEVG